MEMKFCTTPGRFLPVFSLQGDDIATRPRSSYPVALEGTVQCSIPGTAPCSAPGDTSIGWLFTLSFRAHRGLSGGGNNGLSHLDEWMMTLSM